MFFKIKNYIPVLMQEMQEIQLLLSKGKSVNFILEMMFFTILQSLRASFFHFSHFSCSFITVTVLSIILCGVNPKEGILYKQLIFQKHPKI